jgi:hypothetical protein
MGSSRFPVGKLLQLEAYAEVCRHLKRMTLSPRLV